MQFSPCLATQKGCRKSATWWRCWRGAVAYQPSVAVCPVRWLAHRLGLLPSSLSPGLSLSLSLSLSLGLSLSTGSFSFLHDWLLEEMRKRNAWLGLYKRKEMGVSQLVQDRERDSWLTSTKLVLHGWNMEEIKTPWRHVEGWKFLHFVHLLNTSYFLESSWQEGPMNNKLRGTIV